MVLEWATRLEFSMLERTKLVTASSELGRNVLVHGKGGVMTITELKQAARTGLQLEFADQGPGIPSIEQAMTDGYSSAKSLGLGLGGARRLVNEFEIWSEPAQGTRVTIRQWKRR
ncbi:MAG: putative anti-sigma regulatory factor, serine/threonine protein kinase [Ramlibacter sp.]|nr:putative anti-sigma regulatory factor, serine/threonine protein kinase [Ramlibacter sp.]